MTTQANSPMFHLSAASRWPRSVARWIQAENLLTRENPDTVLEFIHLAKEKDRPHDHTS